MQSIKPTSSINVVRWRPRLCEAAGLSAEQRAEGLALTDESGRLTDISMPAEGTEAHATLLVAERLARLLREAPQSGVTKDSDVVDFLARCNR